MSAYRVEIVEDESGKVVKSLPAASERQAEKLENGMMRNLNHAKYSTRIVPQTAPLKANEIKELPVNSPLQAAPHTPQGGDTK